MVSHLIFLFLLFVYGVFLCDWIELFELELLVREFFLVLSCVIHMTLSNAFRVSYGDEFYEFVFCL